jgi:ATP-dependent Clp protease, protease subunit
VGLKSLFGALGALLLWNILWQQINDTSNLVAAPRLTLRKNNTIVLDSEFTSVSVAKLALQARDLDSKLKKNEPLYLVMNSPGGSIEAGLELIDNLNALGRPVHTVSIFSASMGFHTIQGINGVRYVTPTGTLMSHKASGSFEGEFPGQLDNRYHYYLRRLEKLDDLVIARSRGKLTLPSYKTMYENEFWCEGDDCVEFGLADVTTLVACDKSLDGTVETKETVNFLGTDLSIIFVKAACPTITGLIEAKVIADNKNLAIDDVDMLANQLKLTPSRAQELKRLIDKKIDEANPAKYNKGQ